MYEAGGQLRLRQLGEWLDEKRIRRALRIQLDSIEDTPTPSCPSTRTARRRSRHVGRAPAIPRLTAPETRERVGDLRARRLSLRPSLSVTGDAAPAVKILCHIHLFSFICHQRFYHLKRFALVAICHRTIHSCLNLSAYGCAHWRNNSGRQSRVSRCRRQSPEPRTARLQSS